MNIVQETLLVTTPGRGYIDVSENVRRLVSATKMQAGSCHLFIPHTSCSIVLCENSDPDVRLDLENFFARLVPDSNTDYRHSAEGPDDMPAHIRSILTHNDLTLPIMNGALKLGTWQGLYLWEHRTHPHSRHIHVTIMGA